VKNIGGPFEAGFTRPRTEDFGHMRGVFVLPVRVARDSSKNDTQ
jgi:hypothetical protein